MMDNNLNDEFREIESRNPREIDFNKNDVIELPIPDRPIKTRYPTEKKAIQYKPQF